MASLNQLTNGTKTTKPYLDIVCHSVNAQVLDVDTLVVGDLEAKTITLDEVASVPNPPINKVTLFGDLGGILNVTDSVGSTKTYLPTDGSVPMAGDLDFASHEVKNVTAVRPDGSDVIFGIGASATGSSVAVGDGANGGFNGGVAVGAGASVNAIGVAIGQNTTCTGNNDVAIGATAQTHNQFDIAIGDGAVTHGGIAIGQSSAAANGFAIAIGDTAVNNTPNSCLLGDAAIIHVRPNSAVCDLGTTVAPFKACYLRDAQPAEACPFVMYGVRTIGNVATETNLSNGVHTGAMFYSGTIPNPLSDGTVIRIKVNYSLTLSAVDTLTFNFKINGTTVLPVVVNGGPFVIPSADLVAEFVAGSSAQFVAKNVLDGAVTNFTLAANTLDTTVNNAFTLTGHFSGTGGNALAVNYIYAETLHSV